MDDKTPEDVEFEKMLKRSGKAYDKAMPEADTTYGNIEARHLPYKPGSLKGVEPRNLPDRVAPGATLEDFVPGKERPRKNIKLVPLSKGGKVSSASKRADGIAQRGKTKGTMIMCGGGYMKGK